MIYQKDKSDDTKSVFTIFSIEDQDNAEIYKQRFTQTDVFNVSVTKQENGSALLTFHHQPKTMTNPTAEKSANPSVG